MVQQAPALPGAQPISPGDRIYTADQTSNTVTVIDPYTDKVLGTIPLGKPRLDGALDPMDRDQVDVHGLGFSRDGHRLDVISVASGGAQVIDGSVKNLGRYAASWIAGWPNRPSSTAALT